MADRYEQLTLDLAEALTGILRQVIADVGPSAPADDVSLVSVPEAARRVGLSTVTVKRKIAAGELDSVLVGRRRLVRLSAIEEYVRAL